MRKLIIITSAVMPAIAVLCTALYLRGGQDVFLTLAITFQAMVPPKGLGKEALQAAPCEEVEGQSAGVSAGFLRPEQAYS